MATTSAARARAAPRRAGRPAPPARPARLLERLDTPGRVLAVIRLLAVPLFFAAEALVDHPAENTEPFDLLLLATAIYAVVLLVAELRGRRVLPAGVVAVADVAIVAALVATSGGPFSQLRSAFFLLPIGAALLLRPRETLVTSIAVVAIYTVIALTYPGDNAVRRDADGFEITQALFLAWMGGAGTLLSTLLTRRSQEIAALAASRGRLVAQALAAEDSARRRLAEALHDEALQNLLAARQELGAGPHAQLDIVAEGLDQTVDQLRRAVFDLHPYLLEQAGLGPALQAVADRAARRGGFDAIVEVEPDATGAHDQLVFSIARELLANAVKHAEATRVWVAVRRRADAVELTVADDGRGIDAEAARAAPRDGHIGLASSAERAEAVGGTFAAGLGPDGRGTLVRARLPVAPIGGPPGG